jgi:hypothetical protein
VLRNFGFHPLDDTGCEFSLLLGGLYFLGIGMYNISSVIKRVSFNEFEEL